MTEEEFRKIIKEEIRPVKEMVEVVKKKTDALDFSVGALDRVVRFTKDQQSVMNEKLDSHSVSLIKIESSIKIYDEIYQDNKRDIKKLKDRTSKIETTLGLPIPE